MSLLETILNNFVKEKSQPWVSLTPLAAVCKFGCSTSPCTCYPRCPLQDSLANAEIDLH